MPEPLAEALSTFVPDGPAQQRVADVLRTRRDRLAGMSLDDIALEARVSQPTVTRVMRGLGYRNALELRTAAAEDMPGRLHPSAVRRAAALIAPADDLFIFAQPALNAHVRLIFSEVFPKLSSSAAMKPQIVKYREPPASVWPRFNQEDAVLVLAMSSLPSGFDLLSEFANARAEGAPSLVVQAVSFPCPQADLVLSLDLPADTHDGLAALLLGAAVAQIRYEADRQRALGSSSG